MAIKTLNNDVEFEVENIKNVNALKKRGKCIFCSKNTPHLFHLRLQLKGGFYLSFEENLGGLYSRAAFI